MAKAARTARNQKRRKAPRAKVWVITGTDQARVLKWGNSAALRLSAKVLAASHLDIGSEVALSIVRGRLVVKPVLRRALTLKELAAKITPENRHSEIDWGPAVGAESID